MDELRNVGRWATDKLALAKERERLRIEDRLRQLGELDASAREFIRLKRQKPGYTWDQEAEKLKLRMLGLAPGIGDAELRGMVEYLARTEDLSDQAYMEMAERLAIVRARTFTPETGE